MENKSISEKDINKFSFLTVFGFSKNMIKILVVFFKYNDGFITKEIQQIVSLKSPDISKAMKRLEKKEIITHIKLYKNTMGRPCYKYYLTSSKHKILNNFQSEFQNKIKTAKNLNNTI